MGPVRRFWLRLLGIVVIASAVLWLLDFLAVRLPFPPHRNPFATVRVEQFYELPFKSGKVEIDFAGYATAQCVRSLAPHFGDPPCWYLRRHRSQTICCAP